MNISGNVLLILVGISLSFLMSTCRASSPIQDSSFQFGMAQADITPNYPILLNGFLSRQQEAPGTRQKIWAKAISLRASNGKPIVLLTVDTLGIPAEIRSKVAAAIEPLGVDNSALAITATHTHSAPIIVGCAPNILGRDFTAEEQQHIQRYTEEFTAKLIDVAKQSLQSTQPVSLSWAVGKVEFAKNRRSSTGPIDHELPLLAVRDTSGKLLATYVSYACHCVTLAEPMISGDWAGYAQENIEAKFPGSLSLVSIGCAGDQNPNSKTASDRIDLANEQGQQIASEVGKLLERAMKPVKPSAKTQWKQIDLEFAELPSKADFEKIAEQKSPAGYHARKQLARIESGTALPKAIPYPIQHWLLGDDLSLVFLGGEVTVEFGLRLKSEANGVSWVNAYANSCPCYIPSEAVLKQGGYEGGGAMIYYDQPGPLKAGLEAKIISSTLNLHKR
ncbi:MAG: neutral/alkaline non-lysosomal ceramidase N-terminal domain-containing protein [Pirellulales bacterium]